MANDIKALLAAKRADMNKLAQQGTGSKTPAVTLPSVNNMPVQLSSVKGKIDPSIPCIAVFEDNNFKPLKKVIRKGGTKFLAIGGFFYAKTEEEITLLEDYARRGYLTLCPGSDKETYEVAK